MATLRYMATQVTLWVCINSLIDIQYVISTSNVFCAYAICVLLVSQPLATTGAHTFRSTSTWTSTHFTRMRTCAHTHLDMHTFIHCRGHTTPHSPYHTYSPWRSHFWTLTHSHGCAHAHAHIYRCTHTYRCTHSHTYRCTHSYIAIPTHLY